MNTSEGYDGRLTDCLWQAYSVGKSAQATVIQYTIEGDPIAFQIHVAPANQIDVIIQSQDRFGSTGSFAYSCSGLTRQPIPNLLGHPYLIATDCHGPPDFLDESRLTIP